jgi:hypothetical protein
MALVAIVLAGDYFSAVINAFGNSTDMIKPRRFGMWH